MKPRAAFTAVAGVCFLGLFVATADGLPTVRSIPPLRICVEPVFRHGAAAGVRAARDA